jgi:hypothetical protein
MDPKPSTAYFAPSASHSGAVQFPSVQQPRLDEHLVKPETREEMLRGERLIAAPARPPHAERHCDLDYLIRAHVASDYVAASDMLTRAGPKSEFATDTAVRKRGIDPSTGTRHLEELAFEVVSTQTMREITMRAEDLSERGVRRVLAIIVPRKKPKREASVCEWSRDEHRFVPLSLDDEIRDPTLARPLPVRALLDAALADDAVIDALDSKGNRRLQEIKSREREQGLEQGLESVCRVLGIELTPERQAHVHSLDAKALQELLVRIEAERRWPEAP